MPTTPQHSNPYAPVMENRWGAAPSAASRSHRRMLVAGTPVVMALLVVLIALGPFGASGASGSRRDAATVHVEREVPSVENLVSSVVQVVQLTDGVPNGCTGSGSVVSTDGLVLTNAHVVDQSMCTFDAIAIGVAPSPESRPVLTYQADVVVLDGQLDLAVLRISRDLAGEAVTVALRPFALGASDELVIGDQIRLIGYPGIGGDTVTLTTGLISGFVDRSTTGGGTWIKTDATLAGGSSGGAAVNADGELVGVPTTSGTGDDNFVDCRYVADTNGDGVIDDRDSCVPIGGFINGLRPIDVAEPLIRQAAAAPVPLEPTDDRRVPDAREPAPTPSVPPRRITVSDVQLVEWVDDDGEPGPAVGLFVTGAPRACVHWAYEGIAAGSAYDIRLYIDGAFDEPASVIDATWSGFTVGISWYCVTNADGLEGGHYDVMHLVEGELVLHERFVVGN